jgi:hypothetical protein
MPPLQARKLVVALSLLPRRGASTRRRRDALPVAPFTETAGDFVNAEGRVQSLVVSVSSTAGRARARPGRCCVCWATCWGSAGLRASKAPRRCVPRSARRGSRRSATMRLGNRWRAPLPGTAAAAPRGVERLADVPIYGADALVRRATAPAGRRRDARPPWPTWARAVADGLQPAARVMHSRCDRAAGEPWRSAKRRRWPQPPYACAAGHASTCAARRGACWRRDPRTCRAGPGGARMIELLELRTGRIFSGRRCGWSCGR